VTDLATSGTILPAATYPVFMFPRLLLVCFLAMAAASTNLQAQSIRRLDGTVLSATKANSIADAELKSDHVMGAQMAILNHGHLVWLHTYGLRDSEKNLPMMPDTNIWAASITKGLFATWVMRLVEQHRLNLDRPVAQMLPRPLNQYERYRESAVDIVHDSQWQQVTPRMLLSHSSGLANFAFLEPDKRLHLHFPPGTRFAYSGEGLNLLQLVLEEKFKEPLDVAMQRDLFIPLGMSRTGMVWREEFAANTALRYDANGHYSDTTHQDHARAAGSMATTIQDLTRFTEALLAHKILQPSTKKQMFTPQIAIHSAHQFPTLATKTSDEGPQVGLAYGLGWGVLTHTKYGPAFFKEGHGNGAENYLLCFEKSGTCMILLTNSDNGELAFRPLLEQLIGDTVTPWEWEGYTRGGILHNQEHATASK
jgi:CubicO group peptidase (beta-lactamase class C family)